MNIFKFFFFLSLFFCISNSDVFGGNHIVKASLNKSRACIGDIVKLSIQVSGNDLTNVRWDLVNNWLGKNNKIKLMSSNSNIKGKMFEDNIIFTVTKPCKLLIGPIPVLTDQGSKCDMIFSNSTTIDFGATTLNNALSDIKPISNIRFYFRNISEIFFLVLCLTCLAFIFKLFLKILSKDRKRNFIIVKKACLERLKELEHHIEENQQTANYIKEGIYNIFAEYLNKSILPNSLANIDQSLFEHLNLLQIGDDQKEIISKILKKSESIRFSQKYITPETLSKYLTNVRMFIENYPLNAL